MTYAHSEWRGSEDKMREQSQSVDNNDALCEDGRQSRSFVCVAGREVPFRKEASAHTVGPTSLPSAPATPG